MEKKIKVVGGNDKEVNLMWDAIDKIIDQWKEEVCRLELDSMRNRIRVKAIESVELQSTYEEIHTLLMEVLNQDPSKMKVAKDRQEFVEAVTAKVIICRAFYKNAPDKKINE